MATARAPGGSGRADSPLGVFSSEHALSAAILLGALIIVSVGAWALIAWMGAGMSSAVLLASISSIQGFELFLAIWMIMMVAMMFPAAAPMAQAFSALSGERGAGGSSRLALTSAFLATYVAVWTGVGIAVAVIYLLLAPGLAVLVGTGTLGVYLAGPVLIVAGVYQTTPLKDTCLRGCRSPLSFLLTDWRPGIAGGIRLGVKHAAYCVGCCWLLFGVLFAVGLMALPWMALIALMIFVEKLVPGRSGFRISVALGAGLAIVGIAFLALPSFGSWALGLT